MSLREQLFSFQKEKKVLEDKMFQQILEQCIEQIKYENQHSKTETLFIIPKLIIGLPLNNIERCVKFLISELKNQGIFCKQTINPHEIYITWHISDKELEQQAPKKTNNQKIISTKKYDKEDIKILSSILKKK